MTIQEALHALVGAPHLVAFRLPGPQLTLTRRNRVLDHQGPRPRPFVGCFSDFVAIDWQVMKKEDFGKMMMQLVEAARAQRAVLDAQAAIDAGEQTE